MLAETSNCVGTVISNETVCADMQSAHGESSSHLLRLRCPEIAGAARPGQFVMLDCGEEYSLRRPLSVHRTNGEEVIFYFVAWRGHGTDWLASRQTGDTIPLLGPLGNGFTINAESNNLLLVGGGMGIAPLRFLAEEATKMGKRVELLAGCRYEVQFLPPKYLPQNMNITFTKDGVHETDTGICNTIGFVSELLPDRIDAADQVFICGPLPMYRAIARDRQRLLKDKPTQVSLEVRMGCGVGGCFSCSVRTTDGMRRVCKDGPVFNFDDILWDEVSL
jgi:dihydroorotate dehydrogenase electron transfer subunit